MSFMFENLEAYQKALELSKQIINFTESFPHGYSFLTDQLNRALLVVAGNLFWEMV